MKNKVYPQYRYSSVLLIDDNDIDNFINERMITSTYFSKEVIVKISGISALKWLKEVLNNPAKGSLPILIFLDLNMPIMDGFGFLDEYEKLAVEFPILRESCKIIVLSSSISPADINKAATNPLVMKFINKPLNEKYLESIIL